MQTSAKPDICKEQSSSIREKTVFIIPPCLFITTGQRQKLEKMTDSQEDEITVLKERLDDITEKNEATETTLKSAYM